MAGQNQMATNDQRLVLITGANRGIGWETAKQLAGRGWHVVIGARNEQSGLRAAEEINASGGRATFMALDVSSSESIRFAGGRYSAIAEKLDVLINNAGIYPDQ